MLRVIREVKPTFVVGENVAGLISMEDGKTLEGILTDLEDEGYEVESFTIPACAAGAWHRRDRIWIVAYNNKFGCNNGECASSKTSKRGSESLNRNERLDQDVPNTSSKRLQKSARSRIKGIPSQAESQQGSKSCRTITKGKEYWATEPNVGRVANGIPSRVDRLKGLGNAVVPQVVYEIFKAIEKIKI